MTATETRTKTKAATKIEMWPLHKVRPYPKNAKTHPKKQIEQLAKIIERHGFDQPIVVDGAGVIIKGHGRLLAAERLALSKVPVVVRDDLTPAQVREARIADNRVAELGAWDDDMLLEDVSDALTLENFDFGSLGLKDSFRDLLSPLSDELPTLSETEPGFVTMTFTLHRKQAALVSDAIERAVDAVKDDCLSTNKNGNALSVICAAYSA